MAFSEYLRRLMEERETLGREGARALMEAISRGGRARTIGDCRDCWVRSAARGETAEEIAGICGCDAGGGDGSTADGSPSGSGLVDACGTGGDGSGTFNISTAAALVAAAAGAKVAKHGNRAVTSKLRVRGCAGGDGDSGGAYLRWRAVESAAAAWILSSCWLPAHHPAMRAVMPVRKALGSTDGLQSAWPVDESGRGAAAGDGGVWRARQVGVGGGGDGICSGSRHAMVVHGRSQEDGTGMDEFSISAARARVAEVRAMER